MKLKTIKQTVTVKSASPGELFDVFMNPRKHSRLIDAKVTISRKNGASFSAFDGMVTGRNLIVVPNRVLVQSWRGSVWNEEDLDSILILHFFKVTEGAAIQMIHAGLPPQFQARWSEFYWKPLKKQFARR